MVHMLVAVGELHVVLWALRQVPVSVSLTAGGRCDHGCAFALQISGIIGGGRCRSLVWV